ncbi:MAG: hypothetical protein K2L13_00020 [Opitutales bacterium]|nr:hypothetical protein [Opitutales bacterium]
MANSAGHISFPEVKRELLQILLDVGFVAVGRGMQSSAENIFSGVFAVRPESELPVIGLAFAKMCFGDFTSASKLIIETALVLNPNSDLAKSFLGIISFYCGATKEASIILSDVLAKNKDETSVKIAQSIIQEINQKS